MAQQDQQASFVLELKLALRPGEVSGYRRFLEQFLGNFLDDKDLVYRLGMAAHELLENGVKYSSDGRFRMRIAMDAFQPGRPASVMLENRATGAHLDRLRTIASAICDSEDPWRHYQMLMKEAARRREGSGLGLARIRAEGEMRLVIEEDGDRVCVTAETLAEEGSTP